MRTVNQFIRAVESLEIGEGIKIDKRICPNAVREKLKEYIEEGILRPSEIALEKYDERVRDYYRTGWWLADEMTYIKKGKV